MSHRETLLAQRDSYRARVEQLQAAAAELADEPVTFETADEDDMGDADGSSVERDRLLALAATAKRSLAAVDAALQRLDAGTYGRCARCGEQIPAARLEAVPEATHCVGCKTGGLRLRG